MTAVEAKNKWFYKSQSTDMHLASTTDWQGLARPDANENKTAKKRETKKKEMWN